MREYNGGEDCGRGDSDTRSKKEWGGILVRTSRFSQNTLGNLGNSKAFNIGTYVVLGIVSLVMTILNVITDKGFLTYCTALFSICCLVNILLAIIGGVCARVAKVLFSAEVLTMFTFFLVSGNPDGFSAIWICMLPSLGMLFFDRLRGSLLCLLMFLILVFFLWTPFGQPYLLYEYNDTFRMRFPVLFVAFHVLAFLLETLRIGAYKEMHRMQEYYKDLSSRDQLTGLLNRQGMYAALENGYHFRHSKKLSVAMLDLDHFKEINDRYGHAVGDMVLREFSAMVESTIDALVCRWGGEEFLVIFCGDSLPKERFEELRRRVSKYVFKSNGVQFGITVSIGICSEEKCDIQKIDALINQADMAMYEAKSRGRNTIVIQ